MTARCACAAGERYGRRGTGRRPPRTGGEGTGADGGEGTGADGPYRPLTAAGPAPRACRAPGPALPGGPHPGGSEVTVRVSES
ncbi:hypothetical protein GCM10010421_48910 [Streptomyces glaucus]|uniref:Secreted protein n=1 Tax=Streptomyces glaucus TaxID=284029 RepID=A0ABP5XI24_9ACTN